jgi:hypothetical protein
MTPRIVTLVLGVVVAVAAPAVAQRKDCGETTLPKHLPATHEILDSAGVLAELTGAHWLTDSMVFSLIFTAADSLPFVSTFIGREGDGAVIVRKSVRPRKSDSMWGLRVRVAGGASPSVTLARSIYCPPVPEPGPAAPRTMMAEVRAGEGLSTGPGERVRVGIELSVNELGNVVNAHVAQSSGVVDLDKQMLLWWQQKHFLPAMIDLQRVSGLYRTDRPAPRL